jgi:hypothetical protein
MECFTKYTQILKYNIVHKEKQRKNYIFLSTDAGKKTFNKIQYPFVIKSPEETRNRKITPQYNKFHIWQIYSQYY